jgi:Fe-S oxidoreductase
VNKEHLMQGEQEEKTSHLNDGIKKDAKNKKTHQVLRQYKSARIKTWLSICSRCGLCSDACFYYLSSDKDPRLSPAYKIKATLGEMYKRRGNLNDVFLKKCREILWLQCTMCKRCSMYCPFGIDIASMIAVARNISFSQGFAPDRLKEFTENHKKSGNHMGLPPEELIETCEWLVTENEDEYPGVTIPIDKPGVKYMYTINPREVVFYPEDIGRAAILFSAVEESWTIPSFGWDCTNLPMYAGDAETAGKAVKNVYDKAIELGIDKILITECGHAYRSLAFEGPYLAGCLDGKPPVEIVHYVKLLYEYLRDGRIKIDPAKKIKEPVTYQDPCNVSRNGGLWEEARKLVSYLVEDFRDMSPNRDRNHCCGGGGGILPMGPEFKPVRIKSGKVKAEQVRATGAKIVIAPCHNCFDQISDLNEKYNLQIKVTSFKEIILETMIVPDKFKKEGKQNEV